MYTLKDLLRTQNHPAGPGSKSDGTLSPGSGAPPFVIACLSSFDADANRLVESGETGPRRRDGRDEGSRKPGSQENAENCAGVFDSDANWFMGPLLPRRTWTASGWTLNRRNDEGTV